MISLEQELASLVNMGTRKPDAIVVGNIAPWGQPQVFTGDPHVYVHTSDWLELVQNAAGWRHGDTPPRVWCNVPVRYEATA